MAYGDNKVIVVIDDVHSQKSALIFNVIESIAPLNKEKRNNIHFLLAARQPEFEWALERNIFGDYKIVQRIKSLFDDNDYKFVVKYFEREEVKEFIQKYKTILYPLIKNNSIEQNTDAIFKDTQGHPIMVRFLVLNEGLSAHVEQMYFEYLQDRSNNNYPNLPRVSTIILNSLFDISGLSLKDEMLEEFTLLTVANRELKNTIIKKTGDVWKTIHSIWDIELLKYMFSLEYSFDDIKNCFKGIVERIITNKNISSFEKLFILNTIYYTFIKEKVTPLDTIEKVMELKDIENNLDNFSKELFYATVIGLSYYESNKGKEALDFFDKAIELNPNYPKAYYNKGISLSNIGKDEDVIQAFDKAIELNPKDADAYYNKGTVLSRLGRYEDAIKEYDKAIELNPKYDKTYYNKGLSLSNLGRYEEALLQYDKAIDLSPNYVSALLGKSSILILSNKLNEARQILDRVLAIEPQNNIAIEFKDKIKEE